jgi:hypothetical protein
MDRGSQLEMASALNMSNLAEPMKGIADKIGEAEWTCVDIDSIMDGNPHAV